MDNISTGKVSQLLLIVIVLMHAALLITPICNTPNNSINGVTSDTNEVIIVNVDSTPQNINKKNLLHVSDTVYMFYPATKVDTAAIIAQYLTCVVSTSHYRNDTSYDLIIKDSTCLGDLINREIQFKNLRPDTSKIITITNTITRDATKARLYIGMNPSLSNLINPGVMYAHEKFAVSVHYAPLNNKISTGLYINLWK